MSRVVAFTRSRASARALLPCRANLSSNNDIYGENLDLTLLPTILPSTYESMEGLVTCIVGDKM
jgi:hypothetical protein